MAYYLVRAKPKPERLSELQDRLQEGAFIGLRPFGKALTHSLKEARTQSDGIAIHSFLRKDAQPLGPGQPTEVAFSLFPTSVVLNKGHRIRLAIAGADTSIFQHYPAEGTPTLTVFRQKDRASYLELPVINR